MLKAYSFAKRNLEGFHSLSFVSADTAICASHVDNCLYEISISPFETKELTPLKISTPFTGEILSVATLPASCGAAPSSSSQAPTSEPNQKSSFELARSTNSGDFGQSIIIIGDDCGNITFLYCDVAEMGEQGQKIEIRKTKTFEIRDLISLADEKIAITSICVLLPRGQGVVVGTETGHIVLFTLTSGVYQFKQLLRSDLQAPIHEILSLNKNKVAFSFKNQLQIININRPLSIEFNYKCGDSITSLAFSGECLAIGAENNGIVFINSENLEISAFSAPQNDAISSLCCSQIGMEFLASTRRGEILLFTGNGILREILSNDQLTGDFAGGVTDIKTTAEGGQFLALCHSGIMFGYIIPPRLNLGRVVVELIDLNKIKFTDNIIMINDFYTSPEPILGLFTSKGTLATKIVALTATSVILWSLPDTLRAVDLRTSEASAATRTQWIQEPVRTQSFTESCTKMNIVQQSSQSTQAQVVGGVRFENFDFNAQQTEKAAVDFSQISKSSLFIRHSVIFASVSDNYVFLQDVSGECHCCTVASLSLLYTQYNGITTSARLLATDEITAFIEGSTIRVTDTASGNFIIRQMTHQRGIEKIAIQSFGEYQKEEKLQIESLGSAALGFNAQSQAQTEQTTASKRQPVIAIIDASSALFTHKINMNPSYYLQHTQTSSVFQPYPLHSKAYDIEFPYNSKLLVVLIADAAHYPVPDCCLSGSDNPDFNTRLRAAVIANPAVSEDSLPEAIFYSNMCINLTPILKNAASISYEEQADNSSRQIAQFKLLSRQSSFNLQYVQTTIKGASLTKFIMCSFAVVSLLDKSAAVMMALPEFPFILEQQHDLKLSTRMCRYMQFPALWSQLICYAKEQKNTEVLQEALAALGQVPKSMFESTDSIAELVETGRTAKAVAVCCDLWDFEKAKEIVQKDRRCGPILIYLRRMLHNELGSIADEKVEPWLSLAREFGDRANESCLSLIQ